MNKKKVTEEPTIEMDHSDVPSKYNYNTYLFILAIPY